MSKMIFCIFL